jgi:hypothetical protein
MLFPRTTNSHSIVFGANPQLMVSAGDSSRTLVRKEDCAAISPNSARSKGNLGVYSAFLKCLLRSTTRYLGRRRDPFNYDRRASLAHATRHASVLCPSFAALGKQSVRRNCH